MNKKTGYSIYKEEAKKRAKQNTLSELYPKLPNKKFDIIYADPPHGIIMGNYNLIKAAPVKKNLIFQGKYL